MASVRWIISTAPEIYLLLAVAMDIHVWRLAKTLFQTGRLKNALPDFDHRHIALFASIHKGAPAQTLEQDIDE